MFVVNDMNFLGYLGTWREKITQQFGKDYKGNIYIIHIGVYTPMSNVQVMSKQCLKS